MTTPTVFISYSHADEVWKDKLLPHFNQLQMADVLRVWDDRQIKQGEDWYARIKHVLDETEFAVCLISANFLSSQFCLNEEVEYLLQQRRKDGGRRLQILPVLISDCVWKAHAWLRRLQMFPRDGKNVTTHFAGDPDQVFANVARTVYKAITGESPFPARPASTNRPPEKVDVGRLPETGELLFGRRESIKLLNNAWTDPATRIVVFKAWGGVGKSTLVRVWTEQMAEDNYRGAERVFAWSFYSQGTGDRVKSADQFIAEALTFFDDEDPTAGSPWEKGERLARLVARRRTLLLLDGMEPQQEAGGRDVGVRRGTIKDPALETLLINLARDNPGLCVISTREDVADLMDEPLRRAVIHQDLEQVDATAGRALLRVQGIHGTDEELKDAVEAFGRHALAVNLLASYLNETAAGHIAAATAIPDIDVPLDKGKHPRRMIAAWERHFGDHAEVQLLRILGLFDRPATAGELSAVTAAPPIPGLTDQLPVGTTLLDSAVVARLRQIGLIAHASEHRPDILDAHPLIREHFGEQLETKHEAQASESGNDSTHSLARLASIDLTASAREAHRRLYEYLKQLAPELPDNLHDMMPLYRAVAHGSQAGLVQIAFHDVYRRRILRQHLFFNTRVLGAISQELSTVSCFFESPFTTPSNQLIEEEQGSCFRSAGFLLRALGRLREAKMAMQLGMNSAKKIGDWRTVAEASMYVGELALIKGHLVSSLQSAVRSVEASDRSGLANWQSATRARLAGLLNAISGAKRSEPGTGRVVDGRDESLASKTYSSKSSLAHVAFRDAEEFQRQSETPFPKLFSVEGYEYCDLLLDDLSALHCDQSARADETSFQERLQELKSRAEDVLHWVEQSKNKDVLAIALAHLALGRTWLADAHLSEAEGSNPKPELARAACLLDRSVVLLRDSHRQDHLPRGLLHRAALWRTTFVRSGGCEIRNEDGDSALPTPQSAFDRAERDLDEAETIAERGSMLIWQIEAALERCRLYLALHRTYFAPLRLRVSPSSSESAHEGTKTPSIGLEEARRKLKEARELICQTDESYEPYVPDWADWQPPEYVGVFQEGDIVGYHCRNDELDRLQAEIDSLSSG